MSLADSSLRLLGRPAPGCRGSSGPALRTVSRSGAIPRDLSMDRTTSARAALRDRFDVSLPVASAWPAIITRTEKPSPLATLINSRNSIGDGIEHEVLTRRRFWRIRFEVDDVRLDGIAQANECRILNVRERG